MGEKREEELVPCPHCHELIARRAKFCRHCGSDAATGWLADAEQTEGLAAPEFDQEAYEDLLEKEGFGPRRAIRQIPWFWIVAVVALAAFILTYVL